MKIYQLYEITTYRIEADSIADVLRKHRLGQHSLMEAEIDEISAPEGLYGDLSKGADFDLDKVITMAQQ